MLASVIFFELIKEGSKRDSKSAAARGEKKGEHSQILSCDIVEKLPVTNKTTSQPGFLILQGKKIEIYYEGLHFVAIQGVNNLRTTLAAGSQGLNFPLPGEYHEDLISVEPNRIALSSQIPGKFFLHH